MTDRLCLGTAQIGMDYGIANRVGKPNDVACDALLAEAIEQGVLCWDTARSYGDAEKRIGRFLRDCPRRDDVQVVTKVPPPPVGLPASDLAAWVSAEVDASVNSLRTEKLEALLIHDAKTVLSYGHAIWDAMQLQVDRGIVKRIGLSVYDLEELRLGLDHPSTTAVQLTANLLDHRFTESSLMEEARQRGIHVYARSVLLQGVLTMKADRLPASVAHLAGPLRELENLLGKHGVHGLDVALPYVLAQTQIDFVVIGVDSVAQLNENLERAARRIPAGLVHDLQTVFGELSVDVLEPRRW